MEKQILEQRKENESDANSTWTERYVGYLPMCLAKATLIAGGLATGPVAAGVVVTGVTAHTVYNIFSSSETDSNDGNKVDTV